MCRPVREVRCLPTTASSNIPSAESHRPMVAVARLKRIDPNPLRRKSPSDGRLLRVWGQARCVHAATGFDDEIRGCMRALGHRRQSPVGLGLYPHATRAVQWPSLHIGLTLPSPAVDELCRVGGHACSAHGELALRRGALRRWKSIGHQAGVSPIRCGARGCPKHVRIQQPFVRVLQSVPVFFTASHCARLL